MPYDQIIWIEVTLRINGGVFLPGTEKDDVVGFEFGKDIEFWVVVDGEIGALGILWKYDCNDQKE